MGPAARLIQDEHNFQQGSMYLNADGSPCFPGKGDIPVVFDCIGAFSWAYRRLPFEERKIIARSLFGACRARHNHSRPSKLVWEEAFSLLKGCGL